MQKYDVLSCGLGALACTSFFVYNGQDPGTALSITLMATISGLVSLQLFPHLPVVTSRSCRPSTSLSLSQLGAICKGARISLLQPWQLLQALNELLFENTDPRW